MSTTYLSLVNSAILESGADLASYATDGSDFTTNTDSLMVKFKSWVSRAWKEIQQEAYDWEFMSSQGVVRIDPGFLFYAPPSTSIQSITAAMPNGTVFTVYDQDGTVAVPNLVVDYIQDLTTLDTGARPFGALTLQIDGNTQPPLNVAFKSGAEYFVASTINTYTFNAHHTLPATSNANYVQSFTMNILTNGVNYSYDVGANNTYYTNVTSTTFSIPSWQGIASIVGTGSSLAQLSITYNWSAQLRIINNGTNPAAGYVEYNQSAIPGGDSRNATTMYFNSTYDIFGNPISAALSAIWNVPGILKLSSADGTRYLTFNTTGSGGISGAVVSIGVTAGTGSSASPFPTLGEAINVNYTGTYTYYGSSSDITTTGSMTNAYIHSWKSYDLAKGETADDDFVYNVQEIDQKSFRLTDFYGGNPLSEVPITYVPWEVFRTQYNLTGAYPGIPRVVTEDNIGRWRFYPPPQYPVDISFDYSRKPQILASWSDTVFGLDDDFTDIIMWKALVYYGEYDEQPSVASRATKNYKTILSRLELRNREKFHFQPHRMW